MKSLFCRASLLSSVTLFIVSLGCSQKEALPQMRVAFGEQPLGRFSIELPIRSQRVQTSRFRCAFSFESSGVTLVPCDPATTPVAAQRVEPLTSKSETVVLTEWKLADDCFFRVDTAQGSVWVDVKNWEPSTILAIRRSLLSICPASSSETGKAANQPLENDHQGMPPSWIILPVNA